MKFRPIVGILSPNTKIRHGTVISAPGSTHVRLIEKTGDFLGRKVRYDFIDSSNVENLNRVINNNKYDALLIQRNAILNNDILDLIIQNQIKIIYEIDDDLVALGSMSSLGDEYYNCDVILKKILSYARFVIVSTEQLKLRYNFYNDNILVLHNKLNANTWLSPISYQSINSIDKTKFNVLYMGSFTHEDDLLLLKDAVQIIKNKYNNFQLYVFGITADSSDWYINIPITNRNYPAYVTQLRSICCHINIAVAPLLDGLFQNAKSNLKFLEYSAVNVPTICSNVTPYKEIVRHHENGLLAENNTNSWVECFEFAINNPEKLQKIAKTAHVELINNYLINNDIDYFDNAVIKNIMNPDHTLPVVNKLKSLNKLAVCLHLFYIEQWESISNYLNNIDQEYDLFISCSADKIDQVNQLNLKKNVKVIPVDNLGMDVFPFIYVFHNHIYGKYKYVCKIHTKNTLTHLKKLHRELMLYSLLGSSDLVSSIIKGFDSNHDIAMAGSELIYRCGQTLMFDNRPLFDEIMNKLGYLNLTKEKFGFFAGTMFWARVDSLSDLSNKYLTIVDFFNKYNKNVGTSSDGEPAHVFERLICFLPQIKGYRQKMLTFDSNTIFHNFPNSNKHYRPVSERELNEHRYNIGVDIVLSNYYRLVLPNPILFIGLNGEFSEHNKIRKVTSVGSDSLEKYIFDNKTKLRFDPADKPGKISKFRFIIGNKDIEHECELEKHNADFVDNNCYYFNHNDPQFYLKIPHGFMPTYFRYIFDYDELS